jgi:hypothetical protein
LARVYFGSFVITSIVAPLFINSRLQFAASSGASFDKDRQSVAPSLLLTFLSRVNRIAPRVRQKPFGSAAFGRFSQALRVALAVLFQKWKIAVGEFLPPYI